MHRTDVHIGDKLFVMHHSGDYSGDVVLATPIEGLQFAQFKNFDTLPSQKNQWESVVIPIDVFKALVADMMRNEAIRVLEQASNEFILGLSE